MEGKEKRASQGRKPHPTVMMTKSNTKNTQLVSCPEIDKGRSNQIRRKGSYQPEQHIMRNDSSENGKLKPNSKADKQSKKTKGRISCHFVSD